MRCGRPTLLFNSMAVLDALEADYEVVGGPSSCCGVIATKWEGQIGTGARVTANTINRFEGFSPEKVLNWCPTCQLHLGETLEGHRKTSYDFEPRHRISGQPAGCTPGEVRGPHSPPRDRPCACRAG
jgi:hypothetical protein